MWPFAEKTKKNAVPADPLQIVEGVSGVWFYHLMKPGFRNASGLRETLCGKTSVMDTPQPLSNWGYRGHLHEGYCADCARLATGMGVALPEPFVAE